MTPIYQYMNRIAEQEFNEGFDRLIDKSYQEERTVNFTVLIAITIVLGLGFWWWIKL